MQKSILKVIVLLGLIFISRLGADEITFRGKIVKLLDNGQEIPFSGIEINIKGTTISTISNKDGTFNLSQQKTSPTLTNLIVGDKIELSVLDKDWFILSPFAGVMFVPNKSVSSIKLRMIPKYSRMYSSIALSTRYYSIQVLTNNNEGYAIDRMRELRKYGFKNVYYEAHMRSGLPKNGYFYKVKVGRIIKIEEAVKIRNKIRAFRTMKDAFITVHIKNKIDYIH